MEFRMLVSNYIPYFYVVVIIYPCPKSSDGLAFIVNQGALIKLPINYRMV